MSFLAEAQSILQVFDLRLELFAFAEPFGSERRELLIERVQAGMHCYDGLGERHEGLAPPPHAPRFAAFFAAAFSSASSRF